MFYSSMNCQMTSALERSETLIALKKCSLQVRRILDTLETLVVLEAFKKISLMLLKV